jgi:hypothetical protein
MRAIQRIASVLADGRFPASGGGKRWERDPILQREGHARRTRGCRETPAADRKDQKRSGAAQLQIDLADDQRVYQIVVQRSQKSTAGFDLMRIERICPKDDRKPHGISGGAIPTSTPEK